MNDDGLQTGSAETPADFGKDAAGIVKKYLSEIKIYDTAMQSYTDCVKGIFKRYRNEKLIQNSIGGKKYALLWSTIQVEQPALFTNVPVPVVERRWKDNQDITASISAEILDRCLVYTLDQADFKPAVEAAVFDFLMAGRGQVWLRKEVTEGDIIPPVDDAEGNDVGDETNGDDAEVREITDERLCIDAVAWSDFGHNLGRNWKEVTLTWRRLYMSRNQLVARFGKEIGDKVELDHTPSSAADNKDDLPDHLYKLATVYELWDKTTHKAVWIAKGYLDGPLDQKNDPLGLRDFFPCPRPIYSSMDTTSLIPIPDYEMWRDQATEVDDLTARIHNLIKACQVRGLYDAKFTEIARVLEDGLENDMIPVDKWSEFAANGGMKGSMDFLPLEDIVSTISELYQAREQSKRDAAEISGVSDIIRGQNSGPEKTATESRISGQYGTLRLQDRQGEIQRFCRDIVRMMGELIAESFTPETLEAMSGYQLPTVQDKTVAQQLVAQDAAYQAFQAQQAQSSPQGPPGAPPSPRPPVPQHPPMAAAA